MRWILILVLISSLGCSWAITSEGAFANFGQSTVSTCAAIVEGEPMDDCTVIEGAPISQAAGSIVGGLLSMAARMLGASYGVPVPAPAE